MQAQIIRTFNSALLGGRGDISGAPTLGGLGGRERGGLRGGHDNGDTGP